MMARCRTRRDARGELSSPAATRKQERRPTTQPHATRAVRRRYTKVRGPVRMASDSAWLWEIEMAVAAADETQARERVLELCRTTIAGVTHPPTVVVFAPEDWLTR